MADASSAAAAAAQSEPAPPAEASLTHIGFNPRNWPHYNQSVFDSQIFPGVDPADSFPAAEMSTDLLFADSGGSRAAYIETAERESAKLDEAERLIAEAVAKGEAAPPEALAIREKYKRGVLSTADDDPESLAEKLEREIPSDPGNYTWLRPWKPGGDKFFGRSAKFQIGTYASFGKKDIDPRVDGLLVVEVSMLDVRKLDANNELVVEPNGIIIDRYKIERKRSERGFIEDLHAIAPFENGGVMYDMIMAQCVNDDDRKRFLLVEYYAPDEKTLEWIPIYNAAFGVDFRYTTSALEERFHSAEYMGTAPTSPVLTAVEAKAAQDRRQAQVLANMRAGYCVAIITQVPQRESRAIRPPMRGQIPESVLADRAEFLYGDRTRIPNLVQFKRTAEEAGISTATPDMIRMDLLRLVNDSESSVRKANDKPNLDISAVAVSTGNPHRMTGMVARAR